jgi:hypothetical protein
MNRWSDGAASAGRVGPFTRVWGCTVQGFIVTSWNGKECEDGEMGSDYSSCDAMQAIGILFSWKEGIHRRSGGGVSCFKARRFNPFPQLQLMVWNVSACWDNWCVVYCMWYEEKGKTCGSQDMDWSNSLLLVDSAAWFCKSTQNASLMFEETMNAYFITLRGTRVKWLEMFQWFTQMWDLMTTSYH